MTETGDSAEKEHEPTQKRLADARRKGDIPKSPDLAAAAGYGGFVLACITQGDRSLSAVGQIGAALLAQADRFGGQVLASGAAPLMGLLATVGWALAPFFLIPGAAVLATILAQRALTFTPGNLAPRWSRLSPRSVRCATSSGPKVWSTSRKARSSLSSSHSSWFLASRLNEVVHALTLSPALATAEMLQLAIAFLCLVLLVTIAIGGLDFAWQRVRFLQRNRMSRQDLIDEVRQSRAIRISRRSGASAGRRSRRIACCSMCPGPM